MRQYLPLTLTLLLGACSAPALVRDSQPLAGTTRTVASETALPELPMQQQNLRGGPPPGPIAPKWNVGQTMMQGFIGVSTFNTVEVEDGGITVDGDQGDLDQLPLIGGGGQYKLGGERIDYGLEGIFALGWHANASAFVVGGGGAAVAVDTDLLLLEFYGGPFASMFLGKNLRAYGAVGPLFQFADYDTNGNGFSSNGSGFGYGYYSRAGLELRLPSRMWLGVGARWSDSEVDLGSAGDLSIDGFQWLITFSQGV